ncbi:hypothetical protein [Pontibacter sp. G13]|uniref:hypothetical protein n=1 Tax=Pontibacter sp. G13 TaxID=3074898 RepID=UPI00288B91E5|nr:hypothetical protein [Pontibacter sp. G13]WNJ19964.1 hypothetical protein RJD25_05730 [Pontibacter sp. G13]
MNKFTKFFCFCCLFITIIAPVHSQSANEVIRFKLNDALRRYVVNLYPDRSCECNECRLTYLDTYRITQHDKVDNTLQIQGVAKTGWQSRMTSGTSTIMFYAEFRRVRGEIKLRKLMWKKDGCMKFRTLMSV